MPVVNGVAIMGWDYWSLFNADSYIPTFGLFGGPGYIGGHRFDDTNMCIDDPSFTIETAFNTPPALNSSDETSQSDAAFKAHDFSYFESRNQTNEAALVLQADFALLQAMLTVFLAPNYCMDRQEIVYDLLAARLFESKIMAFDLAMAGLEEIKNAAHNLLSTIIDSAEAYTIHHLTLPTNPETSTTITGNTDLEHINDSLSDTAASDRIEGLSGADDIYSSHGGSDWLSGGDGMDSVISQNPTGKDILEGNAGSDILWGGPDDDKVFGGDYGEMETLIAEGETALGISERGDLASGSDGDDFVYGTNAMDLLLGGDGKDLLVGGGGDDVILGDDDFTYATRDWTSTIITYEENVWAHEHRMTGIDYVLSVNPGDDVIYAGAGNDFVNAGGGNDEVYVGDGNDAVFGSRGEDFIEGGDGNDILVGDEFSIPIAEQGNDYIDGGAGDDMIRGDSGSDDLFGGEGNDTIYGDGEVDDARIGGDYIDGEAGEDTIYGGAGNDIIFGGAGNDYIEGDGLTAGDDYIDGEEGNDTIIGAGGSDQIYGSDGDDILHGDAGNVPLIDQGGDYIEGGAGNDIIKGYAGNDELFGDEGNDTIYGDSGNDYIEGGAGDDVIQAGEGNNTIHGDDGSDQIQAGSGDDYIEGGAGADIIVAGDGANTIYGNDGNDQISGGSGNDYIEGGAGEDIIVAGDGDNTIYGDDDSDQIWGGNGNNRMYGGNGDDQIYGNAGIDIIDGGAGADTIYGGAGSDQIYGGEGNDSIDGDVGDVGTGDDYIDGGSGNDQIWAGKGSDILDGGADNDYLEGSEGSDTYRFGIGSGVDTIYNFTADYAVAKDTVEFRPWTMQSDLLVQASGNDLSIKIIETTDELIIKNWFSDGSYKVDQFTFADGTVLTQAQIDALITYPIYGTPGRDTLVGDDSNNLLDGGADVDKMTGRKGNDIYVVDNARDTVTENANEGADTVLSSLTYTLGVNVENLTLTGSASINGTGNALNNVLRGNDGSNILSGGAGNDTLIGGARNDKLDGGLGADTMIGGTWNDTYVVDNAGDVVIEDFDMSELIAADTVQSSVSFTLGAYVENLTLTGTANISGTGNEWNNILTGNGGANTLIGGEGYDTLNGGAGADTMTGGIGDDTYVVDNAADSVFENANEGTDTVQSSLAYTLGANVENLTLTGKSALSGTGNELDNVLTGNSGANTLMGYAGNDTLNGGAGADTMKGGIGNDTYVADSASDVVIENPNEGIDTVKSSVSYTLGAHVENLMISDGDWTSVSTRLKITATGNVLDNVLKDDGSVTMAEVRLVGGAGNDIYEVRNNDVVVENLNEGIDTILSSSSYTLGANVENLTLTSNQAYDGTGNVLDNVLTGSSAVNTLTGNDGNDTLDGNTNNDTLTGGNGSDKYIFRRTDGMDTINETAGISGDTDTVKMTDGISETEPVIVKQNNDLYLFIDTNNYMRVTNQFYQPDYGVERLEVTDGYYITRSDIENIVNTMSAINNDPGMDVIQKYNAMRVDQTYINTLAQSWHQA